MPGKAKRRKRKKHRGTQTGSVERRGRQPRSRQEAMARARNQKGKGRAGAGLKPPTWSGAAKRGVIFALLLFPVSLLFGQPVAGAAALTVIAAIFYVPLGYYTDRFFYQRRFAREQAAKLAKKQERGD
ncbi:MAG: hypothetical protein WBC01_08880 [Solirubrobacterales bacterium]|jgi:hypothetical protein